MMINGWIMSGDTAVASFYGRIVTPILPERCPLCFQKGGDLEAWLESRAIDRHRTNSRILKRILRLGDTSDLNTALHVHGATITDNYWVKTADEAGLTWADVGFRENYFADLALSGRFSSIAKNYTPEELRTATPELTNIGSYEKCWRQQDGHWVMVKSGTPEEHFSEIFTAALGKHLGFDMAEYEGEFPFDYIHEFNTLRTLSVLGSATSELCEPMLIQIGRSIARYERKRQSRESQIQHNKVNKNERMEKENEPDIREERRLPDSESDTRRGEEKHVDQVRNPAEELSEKPQTGDLQRSASERRIDGALSGDSGTGRTKVRQSDGETHEITGSDRAVEGGESDALGAEDE